MTSLFENKLNAESSLLCDKQLEGELTCVLEKKPNAGSWMNFISDELGARYLMLSAGFVSVFKRKLEAELIFVPKKKLSSESWISLYC